MGAASKIRQALETVLPNLATSGGSIEQKIIDVVGTYADSEKIERDNTLAIINKALAEQKITTVDYYRKKASEYQQGDTLSYDPVNFGAYYADVNPSNRLVKSVYVVGQHPEYTMIVNKVGSDGHLAKLSAAELGGFKTYFNAFQPIGLAMNVLSLDVAVITAPNMVIYVEAGTDANEAATRINENLLAAESEYRPLNTLTVSEIADIIQRFNGVRAVYFGEVTATQTLLTGNVVTTAPDKGILRLVTGAFRFGTTITTEMIKVLE